MAAGKGKPPPGKPPRPASTAPSAKPEPDVQAQTRKLLAKHYASKYRVGGRPRGAR